MKKYISMFLTVLKIITCSAPVAAFAADSTEDNAYFTHAKSIEFLNLH